MDKFEKIAVNYLSENIREIVINAIAIQNKQINEIRLRHNKKLFVTIGRNNIMLDHICSQSDLSFVLSELCQGSLYSYSEDIKEGVIATEHGIRAGVCGRAVVKDGTIHCVRDISSINIRIPHRIYGAADALYRLVMDCGSVLVYSKPGYGKTTVLRELIPLLASGDYHNRVAVIDTRFELTTCIDEAESVDVFLGYPRREGIVSAVQTMSPEYIICDEISSKSDAESILLANSSGVKVVVSAHADNYSRLMTNPNIRALIDAGVFNALYEIKDDCFEIKEIK